MILRCTAKLLKVLGVAPLPAHELVVSPSGLECYANLLWLDRRKCLLVTHAETLLSVFIPDVRKPDMVSIGPLVIDHVGRALRAEGLPTDALGRLDAEEVSIAKTSSRVVLGA